MSKPAFTKSASGRIKDVFSKRKRTTPGMSRVIGVTGDRLLSLIGVETVDEIRERVRAEERNRNQEEALQRKAQRECEKDDWHRQNESTNLEQKWKSA